MPVNDAALLALDTSTDTGCVAVGNAGFVRAEVSTGVRAKHSESLLPAIDFALRSAGLEPADLAGIVVGAGPGSFTGLRIAAATAKAFAHTLDVPLFAYSSLLGLAAGVAQADRPVCALLDARRGDVYAACYRFPALQAVETMLEPDMRSLPDLIADLAGMEPLFVGQGALDHRETLAAAGGIVAPAHQARPSAAALLWLVETCPGVGRIDAPETWSPTYHRQPGARRAQVP